VTRNQVIGTAFIFAAVLITGTFDYTDALVMDAEEKVARPARVIDGCQLFNANGQELVATMADRKFYDDAPEVDCIYRYTSRT